MSRRNCTFPVALAWAVVTFVAATRAQDPFSEQFKAGGAGEPGPKPAAPAPPGPPAGLRPTTLKVMELVKLEPSLAAAKVRRGQVVRLTLDGTSRPAPIPIRPSRRRPAAPRGSATKAPPGYGRCCRWK